MTETIRKPGGVQYHVNDGEIGAELWGRTSADVSLPLLVTDDGSGTRGILNVSATFSPSGTQDVNLTKVGGVAVALGQTTMSASFPVTIASNQTALPVSQSGTWNIGTVTSITNAITVNSHAVTNAGTFLVQENGAALTALQLIDDTVATTGSAVPTKAIFIAGTDGTLARALSVTAAGVLNIVGTVTANTTSSTAGVHSNPNITTSSTLILTSNGSRKGALVRSPRAAGTVTCYLSFDGSATTSDVEFGRGETLSIANYTGTIHAITASGSVTLQVVEF